MEDTEETKLDKITGWIVAFMLLFISYKLFGVCADLIRELFRHIF